MRGFLATFLLALLGATAAQAHAADGGVCPRPAAGSAVQPPADLTSKNGVLRVSFNYYTSVDDAGHTLFCFATPDGQESPTLHVNPGDTLKVSLTNTVTAPAGAPAQVMSNTTDTCGDATMTSASVNMHFHGTNVSPRCGSDEVIHTLINSGESFAYTIKIPADEPPGLYWYHPHVHTLAETALLGGASGLIEVMGIANIQPAVAGLPERMLVIRDQTVQNTAAQRSGFPPSWDVSLNYVPVSYPDYTPSIIQTTAGIQEFWRVANASADTIADIQVTYDNKTQPLQVVALDGVPTGSQDGKRQGSIVTDKDIMLPPGARAEFIVTMPTAAVKSAQLITNEIDTGHYGDRDPQRTLATIQLGTAPVALPRVGKATGPAHRQRFEDLADAKATAQRTLYFSEVGGNYFVTVDGQNPVLFDPNNPPAVVTTQGAVEDWTIQNRVNDLHEFHIHQVHFLLEAVNGVAVPKKQRQFYDTYPVGPWNNTGDYPSITVRMDFRGATVGDFVYHCHILKHEDHGMMAIIEVQPKAGGLVK
jgi:FtsP/CotA-like multicopper oxidase with cupredoxin domain